MNENNISCSGVPFTGNPGELSGNFQQPNEENVNLGGEIDKYSKRFIDLAFVEVIRVSTEIKNPARIGALILCSCLIDYLRELNLPNSLSNENTYTKTIKELFKNINKRYTKKEVWDAIYSIRCALVHVYGLNEQIKKDEIGHGFKLYLNQPSKHLEIKDRDLEINLPDFFCDILESFFILKQSKLSGNNKYKHNFLGQLKEQVTILLSATEERKITENFSKMHYILAPLDLLKNDGENQEQWQEVRRRARESFQLVFQKHGKTYFLKKLE